MMKALKENKNFFLKTWSSSVVVVSAGLLNWPLFFFEDDLELTSLADYLRKVSSSSPSCICMCFELESLLMNCISNYFTCRSRLSFDIDITNYNILWKGLSLNLLQFQSIQFHLILSSLNLFIFIILSIHHQLVIFRIKSVSFLSKGLPSSSTTSWNQVYGTGDPSVDHHA